MMRMAVLTPYVAGFAAKWIGRGVSGSRGEAETWREGRKGKL
jgi:hypothetical protein